MRHSLIFSELERGVSREEETCMGSFQTLVLLVAVWRRPCWTLPQENSPGMGHWLCLLFLTWGSIFLLFSLFSVFFSWHDAFFSPQICLSGQNIFWEGRQRWQFISQTKINPFTFKFAAITLFLKADKLHFADTNREKSFSFCFQNLLFFYIYILKLKFSFLPMVIST